MKKNLLLTFDYELFLGSRSGSVNNCLLKPTDLVLDILRKRNFKSAIFFIDTLYLLRLQDQKNESSRNDFDKICKQIHHIYTEGHYVFLHLHPHWLDATYDEAINQWNLLNAERYSFSALNSDEKMRLFTDSIDLLESIIGKQGEWGYRAGGWCIQPFSDFKPYFEKFNIKYDFSVLSGYSCKSEYQNFNFYNSPQKQVYRFEDDVLLESKKGSFMEFPISVVKVGVVTRFLNKIFIKFLYKSGITNYGDGISLMSAAMKGAREIGHEMASIELLTAINISLYCKEFKLKENFHLISHPKMLNYHNIKCMDAFLKKINKTLVNTDFKKMGEVKLS